MITDRTHRRNPVFFISVKREGSVLFRYPESIGTGIVVVGTKTIVFLLLSSVVNHIPEEEDEDEYGSCELLNVCHSYVL